MYTLRTFNDAGVESNRTIGDNYQVINREINYEEFRKAYELFWKKPHVADLEDESDQHTKQTFSFLVIKHGSELIPLYKGEIYYIMTESGKTFSNLTFK